jgi:hypothetical protein
MTIENPGANEDNGAEVLELDLDLEDSPGELKPEEPKEKRKFTPEEQLAIHERQAKKLRKQLGQGSDEPKSETKEKATKSGELGYAEKAFLFATGVKGSEEIGLVTEFMANTGKSLEEVVDSKFFQAELKELRESKASSEAVPKGSKRSTSGSKDTVDYWLAKGELPENTPENQELRRKIVNAKYARETSSNKFSPSSTGSIVRQSQQRK